MVGNKIKLYFETFENKDLLSIIGTHKFVRLKAYIEFVRADGTPFVLDAIVDTGAYMSAIPFHIWKEIPVERQGRYEIFGLSPKPECKIHALVGKVMCKICDEKGSTTPIIKIHTYLALVDDIPLIIGFKDLLSKFNVCFNYEKGEAYIEVPEKNKKNKK